MSGRGAALLLDRLLQTIPKSKPPSEATKNTLVSHLNSGRLSKAVSLLWSSPTPFPPLIYARLFSLCASERALVETRKVESHLVTFFPDYPIFLLNRAIEAYAKCGKLSDARELFEDTLRRDGGTWNAMITAYVQAGQPQEALWMFSRMNLSMVAPNMITFASVLGSCAALLALFLARQVHCLIIKFGFYCNVILGSSLVDVYGKCWAMSEARTMFEEIPSPNAVSWNVIVRRYIEVGNEKDALAMFFQMIRENFQPLSFTFSNALTACSGISALTEGRQIHGIAVKIGFDLDSVVTTSLINMYVKCYALEDGRRLFDEPRLRNVVSWTSIVSGYAMCGRIDEARAFFDEMPNRNVISWNAMLAGYARLCYWEEALNLFLEMQETAKHFDHVTLQLLLDVAAGILDLRLGKELHGFAYRHYFFLNKCVANAIISFYRKCGCLNSVKCWLNEVAYIRGRIF